ncbi:MAG: DUF4255 domain-containing protein [Firmicutes bacterium]|nr:DUF4255 domain-containing protein [Bacillota bacterium]
MGNTLLELLRNSLTPEPVPRRELITLASPVDRGNSMLTIFLYHIEENTDSRDSRMRDTGKGNQQYPPTAWNLYYLLTAYSSGSLPDRAVEEARVLGRAVQTMKDNPLVKGSVLQGLLAEKDAGFKLETVKLTLEEVHELWDYPDLPYKVSVAFKAGPVELESTRVRDVKRIREVIIDIEQSGKTQ